MEVMYKTHDKFKGKEVIITKNRFLKGKKGTFVGINGYNDAYGVICQISIDGMTWDFRIENFDFKDQEVSKEWQEWLDDDKEFLLDDL